MTKLRGGNKGNPEYGDRLFEILAALNLNQSKFCETTGVGQSHLSRAIKGEKGISFLMLEKISLRFPQINISRIFTGIGPVVFPIDNILTVQEPDPQYFADPAKRIDFYKKIIIEMFHLLEDCQKMTNNEKK